MDYTWFGNTGLQVSRLCLGTASFGRDTDLDGARAIFDHAVERGVNFVDTSNVYANGLSEEYLGHCLKTHRESVVVASKAFFPASDDINDRGASRRHLTRTVERSLSRLQTDRLDMLYLHAFDVNTPLIETLTAITDLVRQGKVLYFGVSNWAAWQIATAIGLARSEGLVSIQCVQPMYNLVKRQAEVEILPLCEAEGLAAVPYNALAGGLLTGKYVGGDGPKDGRLVSDELTRARYSDSRNHSTAEGLVATASDVGMDPAVLAIAWTMRQPGVTAPIVGVRSVAQMSSWFEAVDADLSDDLYSRLSGLSAAPPPATDRSEERLGISP